MFRLIAINFSQKSSHFSLLSSTSPCELSEREVTSPSNLKVVNGRKTVFVNVDCLTHSLLIWMVELICSLLQQQDIIFNIISLFKTYFIFQLWPIFGGTMTKPEKGKLFYVPQVSLFCLYVNNVCDSMKLMIETMI